MSRVSCWRKAFNLTKDGRLRSSRAWRSNCAWARVHAEHPRVGELGARSIIPEEALKAVSASARWSAQRGLEAVQAAVVATKAGHEAAAVADISFLGSWAEMEPHMWHLDGEPQVGVSMESRGWHFCFPRPPAHAALHVRARASHLLRGLCAPSAAAASSYGEDGRPRAFLLASKLDRLGRPNVPRIYLSCK